MAATPPSSRPHTAGVKLTITQTGIYRITGADLAGAGVAIGTVATNNIRIFCADTEIPFLQDVAGPTLGADDALIFYGQSYSDIYTRENVYWIYTNDGSGLLMQTMDAAPESQADPVTTFTATVTIEKNLIWWPETPGAPDADFWFWQRISSPGTFSFSFDLPHPAALSGNAALSFFLQGRSAGIHTLFVKINGTDLADKQWSGATAVAAQSEIPENELFQIGNNVTLTANRQDENHDSFYFNRLSVSYERELTADYNRIGFTISTQDTGGQRPVEVSGFTNSNIMVLDVTNPESPILLDNTKVAGTFPYTVLFEHPGGGHDYFAQTTSAMLFPESIALVPPPDLADPANSADYIVITARNLIPATDKLLELRRRQGLFPMAVSVEDIYDTFSGGRFNPEAIKDFIDYAYHNWQAPRLAFVLLAGDASIDYLGDYNTGKKNVAPSLLVQMPGLGLTPSDNPYACIEGDDFIPDLMIGRIPGNTAADIEKIVNKLIWYESSSGPEPNQALFVADDDSTSFETAGNALALYLPQNFSARKVYARTYASFALVTDDIISYLDSGMLITNYLGHGDVFRWGVEPSGEGDFILTPDDLLRLTGSEIPTFVVSLDCLNGYFAQIEQYCLAEQWLLADGGAIGCFAPSGLGFEWDYTRLNNEVFSQIFDSYKNRLGVITQNAKINAYFAGSSADILNSFQLIGDPATRLDIFRNASDEVAVFAVEAVSETGGTISPAGKIPVFKDDDITFSINADSDYDISDVLVDGVSKGAISTFTLQNIGAGHTVRATFKSNRPASGGGGGGGGCFIRTIGG